MTCERFIITLIYNSGTIRGIHLQTPNAVASEGEKVLYGIIDQRRRIEVSDMSALLAGVGCKLHIYDSRFA